MRGKDTIHRGIDGLVNSAYGLGKRVFFSLGRLRKDALAAYEGGRAAGILSESELTDALLACRTRVRRKPSSDDVVQSLGLISQAARRSLGVTPYAEQLMGTLPMGTRAAIQMQTGEGKTLTAAMAAVMAAWRGGPCHVVTANDYLARRDAELMGPLFVRCGLKVSQVIGGMAPAERKAAYACDVTYSTSKELLADFLRDRLAQGKEGENRGRALAERSWGGIRGKATVMRGLHTAIIDEADSVLIDEATVPLIISLPNKNRLLHEAVATAKTLADSLVCAQDYRLAGQGQDLHLTPAGKAKVRDATASLPAIWNAPERAEFLVRQALIARHGYHRDVQYVIADGKVVIVDDRTGRIMEGRSWSGGLHQAIEAKEGLELTDPTYSHTQM
ncbi:MAG: DEAD/DEAH box helicase, partial [Pseudomonadota bacterium]